LKNLTLTLCLLSLSTGFANARPVSHADETAPAQPTAGRAVQEGAFEPKPAETEVDYFGRISAEILRVTNEINELTNEQPAVREPFPMEIQQLPAEARSKMVADYKNHLKLLQMLKQLVKEGALKPGVLKQFEILRVGPGFKIKSEIDQDRRLGVSVEMTPQELREIIAKLPSKESLDTMEEQIKSLERKLSRSTNGIVVSAMGGEIKTMKEALAGLRTAEKLLPQLNLDPKAITNVSIETNPQPYSDFTKSLPIAPGQTLEDVKKYLETVPFAPTKATFAELERMSASTNDPLIRQALQKGSQEISKLDVSETRALQKKKGDAAEHLGLEMVDVQRAGAQGSALLDRVARLDTSKVKPSRAVTQIRFSEVKEPLPIDYRGTIELPVGASDEMITKALNAAPDKATFDVQKRNVERRLLEVGKKMGDGGFLTLDFSRVTHDEALSAAKTLEDLAAKGYRIKPPGKGFWIVSASTPGWSGVRYWDDRKKLVMFGAQATEKELVDGGFIEKVK